MDLLLKSTAVQDRGHGRLVCLEWLYFHCKSVMLLFVLEQELWELVAKWKPVSQDKRVSAKSSVFLFRSASYTDYTLIFFEVKS